MHPQTLRQYDRMGLVSPSRQAGKQRRYSQRDVQLLRQVQQLSKEGVSLEGIRRILQLEAEVDQLRRQVGSLQEEVYELRSNQSRVFAAGPWPGTLSRSAAAPARSAANHRSHCSLPGARSVPSRSACLRRRARRLARTAGHSWGRIEKTTVSRSDWVAGSNMWLRSTPSCFAPSREMAARLA